jgi:hypothetical protein
MIQIIFFNNSVYDLCLLNNLTGNGIQKKFL